MKTTIDGKRYDSDKCRILAEYDHYSHSNNYSGTTHLVEASDGTLLLWRDTNGQDCWITDDLSSWDDSQCTIDQFSKLVDEARLIKLGLITIIE